MKGAKPSASYVTESYYGLNAFYFVDAAGKRAVRWRVVPEQTAGAGDVATAADPNVLQQDVTQRIAAGPQKWKLLVTLAEPGDPVDDATKVWPAQHDDRCGHARARPRGGAGQRPCRDVNYDPTVLPQGFRRRGSVAGGAVGGLCGFVSAQDK